MSRLETAEEFADMLRHTPNADVQSAVEARDRQMALRALDEFGVEVQHVHGTGVSPASAHFMAMQRIRAKYGAR